MCRGLSRCKQIVAKAVQHPGYVYVLVSPRSEYIKIGGTDHPPMKRLRQINITEPYRSLGPWTLFDFRQVTEWRKVEHHLHYAFRSRLVADIEGQKELFSLQPQQAKRKLEALDPGLLVKKPVVDRMFQDTELSTYLLRLFASTGLMNWLDVQGAWTFALFPGTGRGRYFTINIGPHEVAYTSLARGWPTPTHAIVMDRLIYDFPVVKRWVANHEGNFRDDAYSSALPRSVSVCFGGSFQDATTFLSLDGVRRALIAYWSEGLIGLKERQVASVFARYHNWNAVAEIRARMIQEQVKAAG
jgi:hypothetical protein